MTTRGLVLGAGGVLGAAWTIGALVALREHLDWEPGAADVLIGTSAGSVLSGRVPGCSTTTRPGAPSRRCRGSGSGPPVGWCRLPCDR